MTKGLLINNTVIYSFCVISSHSVLGGGKKEMKKNISSTPFMHQCSPVLKQQWQQPTKAPGCFCFFKKHQWFSQWGGVLWEQINNASGFLRLRLHPPIRESSLHRTEGDMGPLEGTRGHTQKLSGDKGGEEPIKWFSSEFFCSSHPSPVVRNKRGCWELR